MSFLFEDLEVYKKAMRFMVNIYALNGCLKDLIIRNQLRRAALSIPLNIAEGQGRIHGKEKRQFYSTARGSLLECVPLIQICYRLRHIQKEKYEDLYKEADEIGKMLNGLIRSVKEVGKRD